MNGRKKTVDGFGKMEIYKPTITFVGVTGSPTFTITPMPSMLFGPTSLLKVGNSAGVGAMDFSAHITTEFRGLAAFTQVIQDLNYSTPSGRAHKALDGVEFDHLGSRSLKGVSETVELFEVRAGGERRKRRAV